MLVDVRTEAEWKWVGVPDLSSLGRQVVFAEWTHSNGRPNEGFVADLRAAGITGARPVLFLCRAGSRSIPAAEAATAAGLGPCFNVIDGFEGDLDDHGHRGVAGWRAEGLPWKQT